MEHLERCEEEEDQRDEIRDGPDVISFPFPLRWIAGFLLLISSLEKKGMRVKRKTKGGLRRGTFYSFDSEEETTAFILSVSVVMKRSVWGLGSILKSHGTWW